MPTTPDPTGLQIARGVQDANAPATVILYGSRAAGDHHSNSDVDLLIIAEDQQAAGSATTAVNRWLDSAKPPVDVNFRTMTKEEFLRRPRLVFNVNYFCRSRQLFLPVHLLFLTTLPSHSGSIAGDVEFQDDRVVDHPVDGRRGCHWVGEDMLPLGEDQVGGDA